MSVSKQINSNIFGAKIENKFRSCHRDFEQLFIECKTDKNQTVFIKCYEEKSLLTQHLSRSLKLFCTCTKD